MREWVGEQLSTLKRRYTRLGTYLAGLCACIVLLDLLPGGYGDEGVGESHGDDASTSTYDVGGVSESGPGGKCALYA
jgi:hypothetical protein